MKAHNSRDFREAVIEMGRVIHSFSKTGVADSDGFIAVACYIHRVVNGETEKPLTFSALCGLASTPEDEREVAVRAIQEAADRVVPFAKAWAGSDTMRLLNVVSAVLKRV